MLCTVLYIVSAVAGAGAAAAHVPGPEDSDWVAPHQNTVTHVDPHAPLAGLPPGEGNPHPSLPPPPASLCLLSLSSCSTPYLVTGLHSDTPKAVAAACSY